MKTSLANLVWRWFPLLCPKLTGFSSQSLINLCTGSGGGGGGGASGSSGGSSGDGDDVGNG